MELLMRCTVIPLPLQFLLELSHTLKGLGQAAIAGASYSKTHMILEFLSGQE